MAGDRRYLGHIGQKYYANAPQNEENGASE